MSIFRRQERMQEQVSMNIFKGCLNQISEFLVAHNSPLCMCFNVLVWSGSGIGWGVRC